ncbi:MAG: hypothetical protein NTU49_04630, partial [Gammaproteobacteria bacterium]|nr:hypothetical protein [Gammaproteobacteria bacterium]
MMRENPFIVDDKFKDLVSQFQGQFSALLVRKDFLSEPKKLELRETAEKHFAQLNVLCSQIMTPEARLLRPTAEK